MTRRERFPPWIAVCGASVGFWALLDPPDPEMLPINEILFALICALLVIWALVSLVGEG